MRPIAEFEGSLQAWTDLCWGMHHLQRAMRADDDVGALASHGRFRQFLLKIRHRRKQIEQKGILETINPFLLPEGMAGREWLAALPCALSSWSLYRRLYLVGSDLQGQLSEPVAGLAWGSLPMPFPAFAVTLQTPIELAGAKYYTIAVSKMLLEEEHERFFIQLFPADATAYRPVAAKLRNKVERAARAGDVEFVHRAVERQRALIADAAHGSFEAINLSEHVDAEPTIENESAALALGLCRRIVVNLCLYLHAAGSSGTRESGWLAPVNPGAYDEQALFLPEEVFEIRQQFAVKRAVIEDAPPSEATERSLCWHFRREHWRRPAGSPLDAPKTIKVQRAEIRRDRAPDEGLPGGSSGSVNG